MNKVCLFICFMVVTLPIRFAYADWQSTLESQFDVVDTFDNLQDWIGTRPNDAVDIQTYPNEFPKKLDGSPSIWQYYSMYSAPDVNYKWIQNHGTANVWRGNGKSAVIDYTQGVDGINRGPGRLAFKIGDSPDDGYDEVYVFFMTKWDRNFFKYSSGDSFYYHRFLKTLDVSAGFKTVRRFGTDEEHQWLISQGAVTQVLHEYGLNMQVYNYQTYSYSTPYPTEVVQATVGITNNVVNSHYKDSPEMGNGLLTEANVSPNILKSEWFAMEYRVKSSNPHGTPTGEIEVWVYDVDGTLLSHQLRTNYTTFADGNTPFNHKWNKFVWGGNRYAGPYCPSGDPLCDFGPVDHFYIDDVVVHRSRIGPQYFQLLTGNPVAAVRPIPPQSVHVR